MENIESDQSLKNRPILVTGSHRSGTTWAGRMISLSNEVCYLQEPFNKFYGPGLCNIPLPYYFPYITEENETLYLDAVQRTLRFKYNFRAEIKSIKRKQQLYRCLLDPLRLKYANIKKQRPLFKDPIAVFSSDWLARRLNFQVLIMVRHPASFAGSILRLGWTHPFEDFLDQPLLVNGPLKAYKSEIEETAARPSDIIDQTILLWNMIYSTLHEYKKKHPGWMFIRHEDISVQPVQGFKKIYAELGLGWSTNIEEKILLHSDSHNPDTSAKGKSTIKLNSMEAVRSWKKRLSPEQIERIHAGTKRIWEKYYSLSEW